MGKLVPFEKRRRLARSRAVDPGEGQVLMFTGVRYQRDTPPVLPTNGTTPARPKRKRG